MPQRGFAPLAGLPAHGGRLAIFDLDGTLTSLPAVLACLPFIQEAGLLSRRDIADLSVSRSLRRHSSPGTELHDLRAALLRLAQGKQVAQVEELFAVAVPVCIPEVLRPDVLEELVSHQAAGSTVVIASSSPLELVRPVGQLLNVNAVVGSVARASRGVYAGGLDFYCHAADKALAVRAIATLLGIELQECYAYSDSSSDVHLLQLVGHAVATYPDPSLRRTARECGWRVVPPAPESEDGARQTQPRSRAQGRH